MTLVQSITDLTNRIADEFNKRPVNQDTEQPPANPYDKQFWRRPSDQALFQYSVQTGKFELITAQINQAVIIDGGNF